MQLATPRLLLRRLDATTTWSHSRRSTPIHA